MVDLKSLRGLLGGAVPALKDIGENVNLIEEDIIDSMEIIMIIDVLESEYNIMVLPEEIDDTNFQSIISIMDYVNQKQNSVYQGERGRA